MVVNYRLSGKAGGSFFPQLSKPHAGNAQQDTGVTFPTTAQGSRVAREQWRALLMTVVGDSAEHAPSTEWGTLYTHGLTSLVPTGKKLPSMQGQGACLGVHSSDTDLAQAGLGYVQNAEGHRAVISEMVDWPEHTYASSSPS